MQKALRQGRRNVGLTPWCGVLPAPSGGFTPLAFLAVKAVCSVLFGLLHSGSTDQLPVKQNSAALGVPR